jgi:hypothetical protein
VYTGVHVIGNGLEKAARCFQASSKATIGNERSAKEQTSLASGGFRLICIIDYPYDESALLICFIAP